MSTHNNIIYVVLALLLCCCTGKNKNSHDTKVIPPPLPPIEVLTAADSAAIAKSEMDIVLACNKYMRSVTESDFDGEKMKTGRYELFKKLGELLVNNPKTLFYDFQRLNQLNNIIKIVSSPDGRLRYYVHDTYQGGTMPFYVYYQQLLGSDGEVYTSLNGNHTDTDSISAEQWSEYYSSYEYPSQGCMIDSIYQIDSNSGQRIYLIANSQKFDSEHRGIAFDAMSIVGDTLSGMALFTQNGKQRYYVVADHALFDWYDIADNGYGMDWLQKYDELTQTIYLPAVNDYQTPTDRYVMYSFNGMSFDSIGIDAGYWLHESLHDFVELKMMRTYQRFTVRIDSMATGGYRYASWSGGKDMSLKPDIVIYGSGKGAFDTSYIFDKGEYMYTVNPEWLTVYKNGIVIALDTVKYH
ncbi:MAG TPA: hypothetical protein DEO38_02820 [Bacteroidales bacterium]|nr:hypothetical protein [Bacteroidales bacterium]